MANTDLQQTYLRFGREIDQLQAELNRITKAIASKKEAQAALQAFAPAAPAATPAPAAAPAPQPAAAPAPAAAK